MDSSVPDVAFSVRAESLQLVGLCLGPEQRPRMAKDTYPYHHVELFSQRKPFRIHCTVPRLYLDEKYISYTELQDKTYSCSG